MQNLNCLLLSVSWIITVGSTGHLIRAEHKDDTAAVTPCLTIKAATEAETSQGFCSISESKKRENFGKTLVFLLFFYILIQWWVFVSNLAKLSNVEVTDVP